MASKTICFINQKGGCGKSSCCFHLGGQVAAAGRRVLLVDADPQASLSQGFFGPSRVELFSAEQTLAACFTGRTLDVSLADLALPTGVGHLDIVCANQTLAPFNVPCPEKAGLTQFALQQLLSQVSAYDLVLIDCPPNLYQCSWNALLTADYVIIPVPPEDFGTQGLRVVQQAITQARQLNPRLELLGHLVTRFDSRLLVHRTYEARLRQLYGTAVLQTVNPEASAFKLALAQRTPVTLAFPDSKAALLTVELEHEILARIDGITNLRHVA